MQTTIRWVVNLLCTALTCSAFAQDTQIYRWTERDGRVSYGTQPPQGVRAEPLGERGSVSVVPAPPLPAPEDIETRRAKERAELLEQELKEERRLRQESEAREVERTKARAECEERYREECNDDGEPVGRRYIVVPQRRPAWEHPPPQTWPAPTSPALRPPAREPQKPARPSTRPEKDEPKKPAAMIPSNSARPAQKGALPD